MYGLFAVTGQRLPASLLVVKDSHCRCVYAVTRGTRDHEGATQAVLLFPSI